MNILYIYKPKDYPKNNTINGQIHKIVDNHLVFIVYLTYSSGTFRTLRKNILNFKYKDLFHCYTLNKKNYDTEISDIIASDVSACHYPDNFDDIIIATLHRNDSRLKHLNNKKHTKLLKKIKEIEVDRLIYEL